MSDVQVLVLRAAGINCDEEIVHAWRIAGAKPELLHVNRLTENPALLSGFQVVTIPGGFSYGDDIAAGVILAQRLKLELAGRIRDFVDRGGGVLGVCNGFQVLVKAGLLPGPGIGEGKVTLTHNDSGRFEARWVRLQVSSDRCPFLTPDAELELPVEHAEGKLFVDHPEVVAAMESRGQIALRYVDEEGRYDRYPANPNGSTDGIAGLCDLTGRIFGLMPHPDHYFDPTQHPLWTRRVTSPPPAGLTIFQNAVKFWR